MNTNSLWIATRIMADYFLRTNDYDIIPWYNILLDFIIATDEFCIDYLACTTWLSDGTSVDDELPF